jgi:hypothetical protein
MELNIQLGYDQPVGLVKQLSFQEKQKLTSELEQELRVAAVSEETKDVNQDDLQAFQQLLLHGPVMADEQFKNFKQLWRAGEHANL